MQLIIFDPLNVMRDSSLHSMPVVVLEIIELVKTSVDVADVLDDDPRIAIAVEKFFMTQFSHDTFVFSEENVYVESQFVQRLLSRRTYRTL